MTTYDDDLIEPEVLREEDDIFSDEELFSTELTEIPTSALPKTLYILPLAERPFFPAQTLPILMAQDPWLDCVKKIGDTDAQVGGLLLVQPEDEEDATTEDFYPMGTVVRLHHPMRSDGKLQFIAEGLQRFKVKKWLSDTPPYLAEVEYPEDNRNLSEEMKAYAMAIINTLKELVPLNPLYSEELNYFLDRFGPNEPSPLTDFAAALTSAEKEELQDILQTVNIRRRMQKVLILIKKELDVAKLQAKIRQSVEKKITEHQRKFFLREQLKVIQQELGLAKDDRQADVDKFTERLSALSVPEDVMGSVEEELDKLRMLDSGSPEYAVTRNYLDWITSVPWGEYSKDKFDLDAAREILDKDHDGLGDVKDRIIEFLAVGSLKGDISGSIILLVGPPGVGKTSIGRSIARALGRKFYRFSVGGMRDEAEIKGHRRTYIGAMPGKVVQAMKDVGTANPIIMLDEIDKIGSSYKGDPASALLEVLDPEQNVEFLDHYLDVRFDLSKVLFICTANTLDTIPGPLLDRMEIIRLAGYITDEKVLIAKHHLWPRQLDKAGLKKSQLKVSDAALRHVIEGYAREAGVRNLEKQLGRIVRKSVVDFVTHPKVKKQKRIAVKEVEQYLGQPFFRKEKPPAGLGIVNGLAWTSMGGATLTIEASLIHSNNRGFKLTGNLGDVMKESAEIAYSFISSNLKTFKGDPAFYDKSFVHVHVPEGATPKDGPSAGITMATALLSLAKNKKLPRTMAMTGELTLTGQVIAVGGIREKVIAARRMRIMELIIPDANRKDFEELPEHIQEGMTIHLAKHYKDVVNVIFDE
ncbi:endopeptidase La [Pseudomonadota bacterium]